MSINCDFKTVAFNTNPPILRTFRIVFGQHPCVSSRADSLWSTPGSEQHKELTITHLPVITLEMHIYISFHSVVFLFRTPPYSTINKMLRRKYRTHWLKMNHLLTRKEKVYNIVHASSQMSINISSVIFI